LKNAAKTSLCVHAGDVNGLEKVIKLMAKYQLEREIIDADACLAADFLPGSAGLYRVPVL
jgi:cytochrome c peroxidase